MIKPIGDFLERFMKLAQSSDEAKNAVVAALKELGIGVRDPKSVVIRGNVATLKLNASQKSEVFLKQKKIIDILSKNPLTKKITVVR